MENENKETQYRFTITEFRDVYYLGIREWYLDFEGEYAPSNNGVTIPYSIHATSRLYAALVSLISDAEILTEVLAALPTQETSDETISGTAE